MNEKYIISFKLVSIEVKIISSMSSNFISINIFHKAKKLKEKKKFKIISEFMKFIFIINKIIMKIMIHLFIINILVITFDK